MHSYKSLAVLALAASTASTAYSAPVQESQQQARSVIGLVGPTHFGDFFKSNNSRTLFPGYITARDTVDLDQRASFSGVVKVLSDLAHNDVVKNVAIAAGSGAASTGAAYFANKLFNNTRRAFPGEPSDSCLGLSPVGTAVCHEEHPIERDDLSARDVIEALQFLKRQLIEELD
jgi:hypothetical protein